MHKSAVLIGSVVGAGAVVVLPELRAYRRLAAITRSVRADAAARSEQDPASPTSR